MDRIHIKPFEELGAEDIQDVIEVREDDLAEMGMEPIELRNLMTKIKSIDFRARSLSFGPLVIVCGYSCVRGAIWCTRTVVM